MYDVLPRFWLFDAEVGSGEPIKSFDGAGARAVDEDDKDDLGRKRAMELEWLDLWMSFLWGGMVNWMWEVSALLLVHFYQRNVDWTRLLVYGENKGSLVQK